MNKLKSIVKPGKDIKDLPVKEVTDSAVGGREVILIAPSQQGKSTLGNFLVSTSKFAIGDGFNRKTTDLSNSSVHWVRESIVAQMDENTKSDEAPRGAYLERTTSEIHIVDTPGLNDNQGKDIDNVWKICTYLTKQRKGQMACAVLVVKYPPLLDAEYVANLKFYKAMFSDMFSNNVVVVVTSYNDKDTKWLRANTPKGSTPEQKKQHLKEKLDLLKTELAKILEMPCPPLYKLDALVEEEDGDEYTAAMEVRTAIFDRCVALPTLDATDWKIPKPRGWVAEDERAISIKQGMREGIVKGLDVVNAGLAQGGEKIRVMSDQIEKLKKEISEDETNKADKDNELDYTICDKKYKAEHSALWWAGVEFSVQVSHPIKSKTWSAGNPKYTKEEDKLLQGKVWSNWWGALDTTLTVTTSRKQYFASEIQQLKDNIVRQKSVLEMKETSRNSDLAGLKGTEEEKKKLTAELNEIERDIAHLAITTMTLDEIAKRNDPSKGK